VQEYALRHADEGTAAGQGRLSAVERRCLFFSRAEGHAVFLERLRRRRWMPEARLRLVFDGPLIGEWSRYVDVCRVIYAPQPEISGQGWPLFFLVNQPGLDVPMPSATKSATGRNWSGWTESNRRYRFGRAEFYH
jgi:hypothetical protein